MSPRPALRWIAAVSILGLAAPAGGLERIAGRLVEGRSAAALEGETEGLFELHAAAPGADLRLAPGRLVLETPRGRIEARGLRSFGPSGLDPFTGQPLVTEAMGPCAGNFDGTAAMMGPPNPDCHAPGSGLDQPLVSQTFLQAICASRIGVSGLDESVCANALVPNLIAGNATAGALAEALAPGIASLLVPLNADPCDGLLSDCATAPTGPGELGEGNAIFAAGGATLNGVLTSQQQALLGCGEFYGTNCEANGIDLMGTEVSALMQAWVGIEGTGIDTPYPGPDRQGLVLGDSLAPQPGTVGFLPGARGPNDPATSGSTPLFHPLTGQRFANEMAAAGWNAMMLTVAFSFANDDDDADGDGDPNTGIEFDVDDFDPADTFRTDGCSFARPIYCSTMAAFWAIMSQPLPDDPRGTTIRRPSQNGAEFEIVAGTGLYSLLVGERLRTVGPEIPFNSEDVGIEFEARRAFLDGEFVFSGYGLASACGNGLDDDGDGLSDLDDPGCPSVFAEPEDPLCDDGIDNDGDGLADFEDPGCRREFPYTEYPGCGLGAELALALLPWAAWRRRRGKTGPA